MNPSFEVIDHSVSGETFTLHYDAQKHMYRTLPKPDREVLGAYYESDAYISHTDGKKSLFEKVYQFVKQITLSRKRKRIQSYIGKGGHVFDFGAGTGDFLKYMKAHGFSVTGFEPNPTARKNALAKGIKLGETLENIRDSFDAITLWHVLEHVYDLDQTLGWLSEHLKSTGYLFVAVPNFQSYDAHYYKSFWAAWDVPRHLYHFSPKAIKQLFKDKGFSLVETQPMPFDAYYVSLLSERYQKNKWSLIKAFLVGRRSNRLAKKSGHYSSLLYILKKERINTS